MLEFRKFIRRSDLRHEHDKLFVFGDNILQKGYGGQAREMRGEPNAIGIPTKKTPGMRSVDFFSDDDLELVKPLIEKAFSRLRMHIACGYVVVWPADGIGSGLAQLEKRAPKIAALIEENKDRLDRMIYQK